MARKRKSPERWEDFVRLHEPWSRARGDGSWIKNADGPLVKVGCGHGQASEAILVRRIVACVNACRGLPMEFLEQDMLRPFIEQILENR